VIIGIQRVQAVTCESSVSKCRCLVKFRWRWRSVSGQLCKDDEKEGYAELLKESGRDWRLIAMRDSQ